MKDFNTWQTDRNTGNFDLVVDNDYQLSDNPWTYWNGVFHLPVLTTGTDRPSRTTSGTRTRTAVGATLRSSTRRRRRTREAIK